MQAGAAGIVTAQALCGRQELALHVRMASRHMDVVVGFGRHHRHGVPGGTIARFRVRVGVEKRHIVAGEGAAQPVAVGIRKHDLRMIRFGLGLGITVLDQEN